MIQNKSLILLVLLCCVQLKQTWANTGKSSKRDLSKKIRQLFMFRGTKFCGPGNIAKSYNDLGKNRETDKCCRTHDKHCKLRIKGWKKKHGLRNWSWKTSSHCDCEERFKNCLIKVNNKASRELFDIYFNKLSPRCILLKTVKKKVCIRRKWLSCKEYKTVKKTKAYFVDLHDALGL